jgi:S1-C subfamily serine protease
MALIPPAYFDAVAALEKIQSGEEHDEVAYQAVATGTILGFRWGESDEAGEQQWILFLVTNRHVVHDEPDLYVRINQGDRSDRFPLALIAEQGIVEDKDFDIAVALLNAQALKTAGAEIGWIPEEHLLDMNGLEAERVTGGDSVFVLGFPMGLAGRERTYVVVRGGVVARLDREIVSDTHGFLIDGMVFPGNSGGPVVLGPEAMAISGTEGHDRAMVIGIVSSYLPYQDVAVSPQTGRTRVVFEENSGLTSVVPLDPVIEIVRDVLRGLAATEPAPNASKDE